MLVEVGQQGEQGVRKKGGSRGSPKGNEAAPFNFFHLPPLTSTRDSTEPQSEVGTQKRPFEQADWTCVCVTIGGILKAGAGGRGRFISEGEQISGCGIVHSQGKTRVGSGPNVTLG